MPTDEKNQSFDDKRKDADKVENQQLSEDDLKDVTGGLLPSGGAGGTCLF